MRRTGHDTKTAAGPITLRFQEPEEHEKAVVTLKNKNVMVETVQLISKTWLHEWRNNSEDSGDPRGYDIHPSSIVFSSDKSRLRSMNKREADALMEGLGNWTQDRVDDPLPLFVYGPSIMNLESNESREARNRSDAVSVRTGMEGVNQ